MAHSPEKKAAVVADLLQGMSYEKAAQRHEVAKGTVVAWAQELKTDQNRPAGESELDHLPVTAAARRQQFEDALTVFLMGTVTMLQAWARTCADEQFIRSNPTGVNELGQTILDRADRLAALVREPQG